MLKIGCIGECMLELSQFNPKTDTCHVAVSGDTLNTAAYLARLLPEGVATVSYITVLGADCYSDWMVSRIASFGIRTAFIARDLDRRPGLYAIETDPSGERKFHYWRSDSAARRLSEQGLLKAEVLLNFDLVYLSGITLAILDDAGREELLESCRTFRAKGGKVAFDSNYRPQLWAGVDIARDALAAQWAECDFAFPSLDDEMALWGEASSEEVLSRIAAFSDCEIAMKTGGPKVWLGSPDKQAYEVALEPAELVVDTTAAGDSFNAGYLAGHLTGASPFRSAELGHKIACQVIAQKGAIVDFALDVT